MKATDYYIWNRRGAQILISSLIVILVCSAALTVGPAQGERPLPEFNNLKENTGKFIKYYYNIQLTASEQTILEKALSEIPAPCCSDHTALTC